MTIFSSRLLIPLHWAVLVVIVLITTIFFLIFLFFVPGKEWFAPDGYLVIMLTGLIPGLVVALGQYLLQWFEFREMSRLRRLKIKDVLVSRDDERYYGSLIANAEKEICVLGVTATRLLSDFADRGSPKPERQSLISALQRGVKLRILIAHQNWLPQEDASEKFPNALRRLAALHKEFPDHFEYRIYDHQPSHTVFRADNECLVGPKFPQLESKNTPTVHTSSDGNFAKPYLDYFESVWGNAAHGD